MKNLPEIFESNKIWAAHVVEDDPNFFKYLEKQQHPKYLWIGCADSRVPATQICGVLPGEIFVHRNVANLVNHNDINCLSVVQYAVEVLKVEHIIICGHYGCGGVQTALTDQKLGLIDNWILNIKDIVRQNRLELNKITNPEEKADRLCELNVREQVINMCQTSFVQDTWESGGNLTVHGWIYRLSDGHLKDLGLCLNSKEDFDEIYC